MDIYARIKQDHDEARELMKKIGDSAKGDGRAELFERFARDMWLHHKLEEAVFYTTLAEKRKVQGEAFEAINEHHVANGLLEELDTMPSDSEEWMSKFGVACEMIEHHMDEEEEETFAEARKVLSETVAAEMGKHFDDRKKVLLAALEPLDYSDRL